ncbi:hypothetical protein N5C55_28460 [Pseudomonas otitidis]|uniref:hypothetical protein n=1 Tax=Metapseudomonas otitidis TaxID=319939 RepID=UPI001F279F12|nr:hypothetical protein [Pseudomonas otitidis]MDH1162122.1 hypothetical protein [Pseudomonas otitidis]MDH1165684.1 hypothetical protein [Pseudomonas otitidis]
MRALFQFSACFALGLVISVFILGGLMFANGFGVIEIWLLTGKPLASLALTVIPDGFWHALTGVMEARTNPTVNSFLQMCAALAQVALVLGYGLFRFWYRRDDDEEEVCDGTAH